MSSSLVRNSRVCILYHSNFGRNDGAPLYYYNVLKKQMDVKEVLHLMPEGDLRRFGEFDYTIWADYGEDGLPTDKKWKIPDHLGKTIYICSDAHIDKEGKKYRFNKALDFDYVFINQERALQEYVKFAKVTKNKNRLVELSLHAVEPEAYPNFEIIKKYDVAFIGHIQSVNNYNNINRLDFLDRMYKEFPNFYFGTRSPIDPTKNMFEDASKRFGESKIVLNVSITDDINMRVFEAMASGSFLLTNDIPSIILAGKNGKHFVTYDSYDDAVDKTKYYLKHEKEREEIAAAGYKHCLEFHTYKYRLDRMFNLVKGV